MQPKPTKRGKQHNDGVASRGGSFPVPSLWTIIGFPACIHKTSLAESGGWQTASSVKQKQGDVVGTFLGFAAPSQRLVLHNKGFYSEIWPETGGGIACFNYLPPKGDSLALFRRTTEKEIYQPTDLACWPLVPYSNRIAQGRFVFEGAEYQLPLNVAGHPHALHGVGWQSTWRVVAAKSERCHLVLDHAANEGWPFSFLAEEIFALNENGMTIITTLTNRDNRPMPYGLGQHPYISRPPGTKLFAEIDGVWLTDDTIMPMVRTEVPSEWDLRHGCALDGVLMDNCFDDLRNAVRVAWPDGSELAISGSDNLRFLVVYNPPQENYVCVEPVSHMTDAINRVARGEKDTGFAVLQTGEKAVSTHSFIYSPAPV